MLRRLTLVLALAVALVVPAGIAHGGERYVPEWERTARSLVGTPYVYGGSSPAYGLDCSGFVRYVVGTTTGRWLPHNAAAQAYVVPAATGGIQPGDILFFDYFGTGIDHVEIALGGGMMVGTSNVVEDADVDPIDYGALVAVGRIPSLTADVREHRAEMHRLKRERAARKAQARALRMVERVSANAVAIMGEVILVGV